MNVVRVNLTRFNNFFNFCDYAFSRCAHVSIEISGRFVKYQIPRLVGFLCLYQSKITIDGRL